MTGHSRHVSGAGRPGWARWIGPAEIGPHRWTRRVSHADEVEDLDGPPIPEHLPLLVPEPRRVEFEGHPPRVGVGGQDWLEEEIPGIGLIPTCDRPHRQLERGMGRPDIDQQASLPGATPLRIAEALRGDVESKTVVGPGC